MRVIIKSKIDKMFYRMCYFAELVTNTPRHKFIILLSLLSGMFNFLGLPMLIPVLEYMQNNETGNTDNVMVHLMNKIFLFFNLEPSFASIIIVASILILAGQILIIVTTLIALYSTNDLLESYRKKVLQKYIEVDWLWLTSSRSGEMNYVALKETEIAAVAHLNSQRLVIAFIQCCVYFVIAIKLSFLSVILAFCIYGLLVLINLKNSHFARRVNEKYLNASKNFSNILNTLQQNKKFFKTSLLNFVFIKNIFQSISKITKFTNKVGLHMNLQNGWNFSINFIFLISLIIFHEQLKLDYAELLLLLVIFNRISPQFNALSRAYITLNTNIPMHLSLKKRLKDLENNKERNGTIKFDGNGSIKFEDVSFAYPNGNEVIKKLNLNIYQCKTIAFVGGSGVGKSTILDLILGLLKPTEGVIYYGDIPHYDLELKSLRSNITYVSQEPTLIDATLKENLTIGCENISDEMIKDICKKTHLEQFIYYLPEGLNTQIGENGIKLSGGQRQRVVLARSLFMNPKILILDEATSELDSESEAMIQETISNLKQNLTIIIVAHRLSTVKLADVIYVVDEGNICESGTYDELIKQKGKFHFFNSLQT